jgi:hypothetical protein
MPVSGIPDLLSALYTQGTAALTDATVSYGTPVTMAYGDFLMIGVDAVDVLDSANSADSQQEVRTASTQHPAYENGSVTLAASSFTGETGDAAQMSTTNRVFEIAGVIKGLIRTDKSLGLNANGSYPFFVIEYGTDHRLVQVSDEQGTGSWLIFNVSFSTKV